ncbi:hypothetical protein BaRGS_00026954, partial [Batillaria attramentaria]
MYPLQESCPPPDWHEVIPGPEFQHLGQREASWVGRAYGALRLLQFLQHMETTLPDHLIGCDIKLSNYGVCDDGSMRWIDNNDVFFNSSMEFHMKRTLHCTQDSQCVYQGWGGCHGFCDVHTGTCYMKHNPNVQVYLSLSCSIFRLKLRSYMCNRMTGLAPKSIFPYPLR